MSHLTTERAIYAGRVQGVGFRYRVRERALAHAITGWVKNLDDGSVELVATGTNPQLEDFFDDVQRSLQRFILHTARTRLENVETFEDFSIRR
jgi:acylphosphatase